MQHDHILKPLNFSLGSTHLVRPTGPDTGIQAKILFDMWYVLYLFSPCKKSDLGIEKLKYLTFDPWGQGGRFGIIFDTAMPIYRHWVIIVQTVYTKDASNLTNSYKDVVQD